MKDGKDVASMMIRRIEDPKVNVRKSAIQALESLIKLERDIRTKEVFELISIFILNKSHF